MPWRRVEGHLSFELQMLSDRITADGGPTFGRRPDEAGGSRNRARTWVLARRFTPPRPDPRESDSYHTAGTELPRRPCWSRCWPPAGPWSGNGHSADTGRVVRWPAMPPGSWQLHWMRMLPVPRVSMALRGGRNLYHDRSNGNTPIAALVPGSSLRRAFQPRTDRS